MGSQSQGRAHLRYQAGAGQAASSSAGAANRQQQQQQQQVLVDGCTVDFTACLWRKLKRMGVAKCKQAQFSDAAQAR
jgi:hypothetical protein